MTKDLYRYRFTADVPIDEIEASLLLAVVATESLHGGEETGTGTILFGTRFAFWLAAWQRQEKMPGGASSGLTVWQTRQANCVAVRGGCHARWQGRQLERVMGSHGARVVEIRAAGRATRHGSIVTVVVRLVFLPRLVASVCPDGPTTPFRWPAPGSNSRPFRRSAWWASDRSRGKGAYKR